MNGLDYSMGMPSLSAMKSGSIGFVCRYVGYTSPSLPQTKILTSTEAQTLSRNGQMLVSNFEWYNYLSDGTFAPRTREGFAAGATDARVALAVHNNCGGGSSSPIYFSVDYNSDGTDVLDYFKGAASVLGLKRVGAYGGYRCIKFLFDNGLISYGWQTYAWSGDGQGGTLWDSRAQIRQTQNAVQFGGIEVDLDVSMVSDFGGWMAKPWYDYDIVVPFGNKNYDAAIGGAHDLDIGAPPNYPVTALVSGVVSDISAPDWGKQVGIRLDTPINGVPWLHYLHLSAVNPSLAVGQRVSVGQVIGWVGGGNSQAQYSGTSNPTGQNFINSSNSSSRIQVGVALMNGPIYGGYGWETWAENPPIDHFDSPLNPTGLILASRTAQGGSMGIPIGWQDVSVGGDMHLTNPSNSYIVRGGFRKVILANNWSGGNIPLENESGDMPNPEEHTAGVAGKSHGTRQTFVSSELLYFPDASYMGFGGGLGADIMIVRSQRDKALADLDAANKIIAALEAAAGLPADLQSAINIGMPELEQAASDLQLASDELAALSKQQQTGSSVVSQLIAALKPYVK